MQTFRPYLEHAKTARVLDGRRLGKQRLEAKQIALAILRKAGVLNDNKKGWLNHPVVNKWYNQGEPYLLDLGEYFKAIVEEYLRRGYKNTVTWLDPGTFCLGSKSGCPLSHTEMVEYRRTLLYKDPSWYANMFTLDEVEEVLATPVVFINGVNGALLRDDAGYHSAIRHINEIIRVRRTLGDLE